MVPQPAAGRVGRLGPVAAIFFANVDAIKFAPTKSAREQQRMAKLVAGLITEHAADLAMAAEIVIKTGERSLLTYLIHPLTKRMAASMKEE
jgi:hypothetical protein